MNPNGYGTGPFGYIIMGVAIIIAVVVLVASYQQISFTTSSPIKCNLVIDHNDNQTHYFRNGNSVKPEVVYHGYDTCIYTINGTEFSNTSIGYGTEEALMLSEMIRGYHA